jgi:AcrR family transcriptional regulator
VQKPNEPESRRAPLSRDRVLDAGVALADAEGINSVTMRRLGRELGVEAMALYNHINNKDDLLDGILDRVAAEIELPEGSPDWRNHARRRAISAHAALVRHPWAGALWTTRINLGLARLRYLDSALRSLREAGFPPDLLDRTFHAVENHIVGHAMQTVGLQMDRSEMLEMGEQIFGSFPVKQYPDLAAHIHYHLEQQQSTDEFEFGLDLLLDGLERIRLPSGHAG